MGYRLAGHLWSAITLALALSVALAAEFVAAGPSAPRAAAPVSTAVSEDLDSFLAPLRRERDIPTFEGRIASDPLSDGSGPREPVRPVAQARGVPTVSASGRRARRLTAILIADDRPVAVLDEMVVSVGDRLPDGARVEAIQSDGVWVVERSGRRRLLTLTPARP